MKTLHWIRCVCAGFALSAMAVEVPVSPEAVRTAAPADQYNAVAASNGDEYLVVWSDERADARQTYATRVSRSGEVLDPNGFRVATAALDGFRIGSDLQVAPLHVVWGGESWFVLSNPCGSIKLVRVSRSGAVLDSRPRAYSYGAVCPEIAVTSDGEHVVVGYITSYGLYEAHALFLDAGGNPVTDVLLMSSTVYLTLPAITSTGDSFVAVWRDRAIRFDRGGTIADAAESFEGSSNGTMAIASDGEDMLVVRGSHAFRLSADLVAEPAGVLPFSYVKSMAWTGSGYVITGVVPTTQNNRYHEGNVNIVRVDDDGHATAQREVRTEGLTTRPPRGAAVASNGENVLVAWHDPTEAQRVAPARDSDVFLSVLSLPGLATEGRTLLSVSAGAQRRPVTAASPTQLLTVWEEAGGIHARRHRRDGRFDGAPIRLTDAATSMDVVFDGSDFIVATVEGTELVTRRLQASGDLRVLNTSRYATGGARAIALANSGGVTVAAWLDHGLYAARVSLDGSLAGTPSQIAPEPLAREAHRVSISGNGQGEYLVVWGGSTRDCFCNPFAPGQSGILRAARVTTSLTVLDRPPIEIATAVVAAGDARANPQDGRYDPAHSFKADHPSVTWNGSSWLVVWNRGFRDRDGVLVEEIRGRRVASNGTLLDGSASDAGVLIVRDGFAPTVAWTGSRYALTWYEGVPGYRAAQEQHDVHRVRGAFLDTIGGPLRDARTIGESTVEEPLSIAVSDGFPIVAYARLADDATYGGVLRAFLDVPPHGPRRRSVRK